MQHIKIYMDKEMQQKVNMKEDHAVYSVLRRITFGADRAFPLLHQCAVCRVQRAGRELRESARVSAGSDRDCGPGGL